GRRRQACLAQRGRDLGHEGRGIELGAQVRNDRVAFAVELNPFRLPEYLAEVVQRDVEAVAHLRGRCVRPERDAHLLARTAARVAEQVEEELARLRLPPLRRRRSEEHTSELQSRENLVCRLLLEKKNEPPARDARLG